MAVKVLINTVGQQIVADTKQVENKESGEVVAYWVGNPRVVVYNRGDDDGAISVGFANYCLVSDENEFTIRADSITSILEPRDDVAAKYAELVNPPEDNEPSAVAVEGGDASAE